MSITFGAALRRLRKKRGLTLTQVAERINVSYPAVQQWEADRTSPIGINVSKLSEALGADVGVLRLMVDQKDLNDDSSLERHLNFLIEDFDRDAAFLVEASSKGIEPHRYSAFQIMRERLVGYREELLQDRSGYRDVGSLMAVAETAPCAEGGDFLISGRVKDYISRPFNLQLYTRTFGLIVKDNRLSPKFEEGDLIIYNEHIPAKPNDYAIISREISNAKFPKYCYLRRIIDVTQQEILAQQFAPMRYERFALSEGWTTYAVMTLGDMLTV